MQHISVAFIVVKSVKFAYSMRTEDWIYIHFAKTFMAKCKWNSLKKFRELSNQRKRMKLPGGNRSSNKNKKIELN